MSDIKLKTLFNQLIGTWALHRDIYDPAGHSTLIGSCVFTSLDDNRILCEEQFGHTSDYLIRRAFGNVYEPLLHCKGAQVERWLASRADYLKA